MKNKTRYYSVMIMILTALSLLISSCGGDTPLKPSREDIPKWEQAYPKFSNLYETGLDLRVQINEDGMIYYVILPDNAIAPTATEVRSGGINGSIIEGSTNVKGNTEGVIKISGLAKSGKYDIYVVAEDFVLTPNLQEYPAKIDIDTTDDITSPEWLYGFPKAVNIDATAFDLKVCINEPGRVYYMVVLNNAEAPVSEAVKAGKYAVASGSVIVIADTESIINITGLINNTDYDVYVVSEDNAGRPNIQSSPFKLDIKTVNDTTPPEWISTYPQTDSIGPTSLDIKVKINESGLVYYSVLPNNSPAPSSGDVKSGKDAVKSGVVLAAADTEKTIKISGLTGGTEYDVYITSEDYKINLQTSPVKLDVTTRDINDSDIMVLIERGTFSIGNGSYQMMVTYPAHPHMVTLTYDFYIGKYEVTFGEYDDYCFQTGTSYKDSAGMGRGERPVMNVIWNDTLSFCNWKSDKAGLPRAYDGAGNLLDGDGNITTDITKVKGYRLTTEAEWEYTARNKGTRPGIEYSGSDTPDDVAWYSSNSGGTTHPVGQKNPNELGIYDMSGNVSEFCHDGYVDYGYNSPPKINPIGVGGSIRMIRGGSYRGGTTTSYRLADGNNFRGNTGTGFRIARTK